nr:MAG TPA: hypothetical protein [Caudoviricetes sp.]DAN32858.1 MAG TPA: hypothetical protein [Caudoviricetes sp.]
MREILLQCNRQRTRIKRARCSVVFVCIALIFRHIYPRTKRKRTKK